MTDPGGPGTTSAEADAGLFAERTQLARARTRMTALVAALSAGHLAVESGGGRVLDLVIAALGCALVVPGGIYAIVRAPRRDGLDLAVIALLVSIASAVAAVT